MSLRITGIATLTRDAELQATEKGAWMKLGLATKRKNARPGKQDVDFFEASYFLKNADSPLMRYMNKGTSIFIDNAQMRADRYEKDGQTKTMNKLFILDFDLLNTKEGGNSEKSSPDPVKKEEPKVKAEEKDSPSADDGYEDEVPF